MAVAVTFDRRDLSILKQSAREGRERRSTVPASDVYCHHLQPLRERAVFNRHAARHLVAVRRLPTTAAYVNVSVASPETVGTKLNIFAAFAVLGWAPSLAGTDFHRRRAAHGKRRSGRLLVFYPSWGSRQLT